jgi:nucleoside-diphosphate-sugar epimerase
MRGLLGTAVLSQRLRMQSAAALRGGRGRNSEVVLALAAQGVRSSVVRLPRSVHQRGSAYGFGSVLIAAAQKTGVSAYVGDGTQRWPAVNRLDAAALFRIALEDAAPGTVLHAVADEDDTMRPLADPLGCWEALLSCAATAALT